MLLTVSCSGNKIPPLVIHRSTAKVKINNIYKKEVECEFETGKKLLPIWVGYNETAYNNAEVMMKWLQEIFAPAASVGDERKVDSEGDLMNAILFMDNFSGHDRAELLEAYTCKKIKMKWFAPNCTPLLQPLDHSLNAKFKQLYETQWCKWFIETGSKIKTKGGEGKGLSRASDDTINSWVATSFELLNTEHIKKAWASTLMGEETIKNAKINHAERLAKGEIVTPHNPNIAKSVTDEAKKAAKKGVGDKGDGGEFMATPSLLAATKRTNKALSTLLSTNITEVKSTRRSSRKGRGERESEIGMRDIDMIDLGSGDEEDDIQEAIRQSRKRKAKQ